MSNTTEVENALTEIEDVVELLEGLPEAEGAFAERSIETLRGIGQTLESRQHVTLKQLEAIENIRGAAERSGG